MINLRAGRDYAGADSRQLTRLIKEFGRCKNWKKVLETLAAAPASVVTWSAGITACNKCNRWPEALGVFQRMQTNGISPDLFALNVIAIAHNSASRWIDALEVLQDLQTRSFEPSAKSLSPVMSACSQATNWQISLALRNDRFNHGNDAVLLNCAMTACQRGNCWLQALRHCQSLISFSAVIAGTESWSQALCFLMELCCRSMRPDNVVYSSIKGSWRRSISFLKELSPDVVTFGRMVTDSKDWAKASVLLQEMAEFQLEYNLVILNAVMSSMEESEEWPAAFRLLQNLQEKHSRSDVVSLSAAISAARSSWQRSWAMLRRGEARALRPNIVSFTSVLSACERATLWQLALHCVATDTVDLSVVACNAAISACEKGSQWQEATRMLSDEWSQRLLPDPVSITAVTAALERCQADWSTFQSLLRFLEKISLEPDCIAYSYAMSAAMRLSCWLEAAELTAKIHQRGLDFTQVKDRFGVEKSAVLWKLSVGTAQALLR